jgi:Zn-dependent protease with chaperone function
LASPSLTARALQAVALFVGFYLLALALIAALVAAPLAEAYYANRIEIRLLVFCLASAWAIAWGVVPRIDRFAPPGPLLDPAKQPRLFAKLRAIARETAQPMPEEVFLVFDLNAWVAQRGGVMGFGGRPIMGLGLPLLQLLSISELQGVIAHEFGHFSGADTKLGPWVYKTRAAIGRTIASLGNSWLRKPFEWYGEMFLSLTQAVSRQQELSADALAARVAGPSALRGGLRRIHGAAPAFQFYLRDDLGPLLNGGFRPPIAEGFARFTRAPRIAEAIRKQAEEQAASGTSNKYDTHPSLREREAALAGLPEAGVLPADPAEALTLLDGVPELELALELGED